MQWYRAYIFFCFNPNNRQLWLHQNPTSLTNQDAANFTPASKGSSPGGHQVISGIHQTQYNRMNQITSTKLPETPGDLYRNIRHGLGVTSPNCTIYYVHFIKEIKINMLFGTIFHSITHPDVFGAIKMSNLLPNLIGFECQYVFFSHFASKIIQAQNHRCTHVLNHTWRWQWSFTKESGRLRWEWWLPWQTEGAW